MNFVLDTHIFLWVIFKNKEIPENVKKIFFDYQNNIFVSSITFWEISLKYSLNKLSLEGVKPEELPDTAISAGIDILDISSKELASFYKLPKLYHKDPFDRMIIWQCIQNDFVLLSKDRQIKDYQNLGLKVVW